MVVPLTLLIITLIIFLNTRSLLKTGESSPLDICLYNCILCMVSWLCMRTALTGTRAIASSARSTGFPFWPSKTFSLARYMHQKEIQAYEEENPDL